METNLPDIIKDRKTLPDIIKKDITNTIFFNCILFIIMMMFTLIVNISFNELYVKDFESYIDIIQIFCGVISIVVLEIAYRKDSGRIGLYGVEFLIFSIGVLFVPYMYIFKSNISFLKNVITVFAGYYFIKSLTSFLHTRNKYLRENMSDIKELVKEEKESYLDEESTKTLKKQKLEEERKKKAKEEKLNAKKTAMKNKKDKIKKDVKKRGGKNND